MRFDRTAAGEGVEAQCRLENGKALLKWQFHFESDGFGQDSYVRLRLTDREERLVLECLQQTGEEEPLESVLLHPRLWRGVEEPYLYRLEAELISRTGEKTDKYVRDFPLYTLTHAPGKGLLLNGELFCPRTVRCRLPEAAQAREKSVAAAGKRNHRAQERSGKAARELQELLRDLQLARRAGANGIFAEGAADRGFYGLCERMGFLVWNRERPGSALSLPEGGAGAFPEDGGAAPLLRGDAGSLLKPDGTPSSLFYRYRAKWSKSPFVYIVPESIRCGGNGNFSVSVYSSCKKVALYADGVLHAFLSGGEEFVFREIAPTGPCLTLTAEAEECAQSLSVHRSFTKSSLFHDI